MIFKEPYPPYNYLNASRGWSSLTCKDGDYLYRPHPDLPWRCDATPCEDGINACEVAGSFPDLLKGDNDDDGEPDCATGNPINIANGNKYQEEKDYIGPLGRLNFYRSYNSSSGSWRHSYEDELVVNDSGLIAGLSLISRTTTLAFSNQFVYNAGVIKKIEQSNNGDYYNVDVSKSTNDNSYEIRGFEVSSPYSGKHYNGDGQLDRIVSLQGQAITLERIANDIIVSDHVGRSIKITNGPNGNLTRFEDVEGNVYHYTYTSDRLTSVTFPDGETRIYHYEDNNNTKLLTGITDENGNRFASWHYDPQGRAIHSDHNGVDDADLVFNTDGTVTVTNALGKNTVYTFETHNDKKLPVSVAGQSTTSCVAANTAYSYDANGYRFTQTDWDGKVTKTVRNDRGLITELEEGLHWSADPGSTLIDTDNSKKITTSWHHQWALPTMKVSAEYLMNSVVCETPSVQPITRKTLWLTIPTIT